MPLWIGQSFDEHGKRQGGPIVFDTAAEAKRWMAVNTRRRIWNAYANEKRDKPERGSGCRPS